MHRLISLAEAKPPFFVGIDLGGTSVKLGVVDDHGRTLLRFSIPTETKKGPEDASRRMGLAVHRAIEEAGLERSAIAGVGLGSAGPMDIPGGKLRETANLPGWNWFPLRDRVAHHCGMPVIFTNDAAAAAYGEFWVGSGQKYDSMTLLTLGTGIGCGIIIDGYNLIGENSYGAESGHITINSADDARMCGCGRTGHLEAYASATAVTKITRETLDGGRASSLTAQIAHGTHLSPKLVAQEAEAGDPLSMEIVLGTARHLGVGIVSIMHTIATECVLLGGAMTFGGSKSPLGRQFLAGVREEVLRRAVGRLAERTTIDFASLGGDAGYLGAAGTARAECRTR
jgi:glucokinase